MNSKLACSTDKPATKPSSRSQDFRVTEDTDANESIEHSASGPAPTRENPELSLKLALAAAHTAAVNGGTDILVLDMAQHTAIFDYFVIATGTSRRQLHAISEDVDRVLENELNDKRMHIDGYDDSKWIVLDYGTVVIHLFDEDTRKFYSLESLYACLLYTSPSPRDATLSRMPSSA